MSYASLRDVKLAPRALFKKDHPRAIDQHINYFGGDAGETSVVDPCGEAFLASLDSEEGRAAAFLVEVAS